MIREFFMFVGFFFFTVAAWSAALNYPGAEPGPAHALLARGSVTFSNTAVAAVWGLSPHGVSSASFRDVRGHHLLKLNSEVFQIVLTDGKRFIASDLVTDGMPRLRSLTPKPRAARLAARIAGKSFEVPLHSPDGRLQVVWRAVLLDGSHYIRQEIALNATREPLEIREIVWLDAMLSGASAAGSVAGSPIIVADNFFLGSEDPMAENSVESDGSISNRVRRTMRLAPGTTLTQSFVLGVAPAGQMRRAFLSYLERERAHPFRPLLHYNSWYDISWPGASMNESNCLAAIHALADDFIRPYGVVLDGVLFDDGWDDPKSLWQFHPGFPRGFAPHARLCHHYGLHLGVWLSPFGGYDKSKQQRLQFGAAQGYETNVMGFALSGPKYYENFRAVCLRMMRNYGVNHFKFDGIASAMNAKGSRADYLRDLEALRQLMLDLRREDASVYINFTTGSWPSPFWLRYADSIWRGGGDMGFAGKGRKQQQWITYRDGMVRKHIVGRGPLFPLNSLMTQGVAWSRHGSAAEADFNSAGFKDDVRMFFGSGTTAASQPTRLGCACRSRQVVARECRRVRGHALDWWRPREVGGLRLRVVVAARRHRRPPQPGRPTS